MLSPIHMLILPTCEQMSTSLTIPNVGMKPIGAPRGGSVTMMNPAVFQGGSISIVQGAVQAAPQYQCINPGNVSRTGSHCLSEARHVVPPTANSRIHI